LPKLGSLQGFSTLTAVKGDFNVGDAVGFSDLTGLKLVMQLQALGYRGTVDTTNNGGTSTCGALRPGNARGQSPAIAPAPSRTERTR
jgi:hypothetical protein